MEKNPKTITISTSQDIPFEETKVEEKPQDQLMVSFRNQKLQDSEEDEKDSLDSDQDPEISENSSENISEKEYADLTKICMASPEEDVGGSTSRLHPQEINTPS